MAQNTSLSMDSLILDQATGPVSFKLTNDYLFRAVMQKNQKVLKGLVCALLHLEASEVSSFELRNPIVLGEQIDAKTFIFDLRIQLNKNQLISIELQISNYQDWPERSIGYLSREFDQLNRGENYIDTLPVHQISILNFTLFNEFPEFYARYLLMNQKNYQIYSDKFRISVLDLTQIHRATKEDTDWELDYWARFFLAETWEDIKMLAENNENIKEAAVTMYAVSAEENIRLQCEARERYESERKSAIRLGEILGETRGMERGMEQGMERGITKGIDLAKKIFKLDAQGTPILQIAKECEISVEKVTEILEK